MTTTFPTTLQDLDGSRGTTNQRLSSPDHITHHTKEDDTIEALQTKVGIDSSADTTSIDYKLKSTSSIDPGHKHTSASITDLTTTIQSYSNRPGFTVNYAGGNAVCIDNFNRPDSSSIGGRWTSAGAAPTTGYIVSNTLQYGGDTKAGYIYQPQPTFFVVLYGLRCTYKSTSQNTQFLFGMFADLADRLNGYGIWIDVSNKLSLMDNQTVIVSNAFTFTNNTEYTLEILYLTGNAVEIRAWASSGSRPSSATITQGARSRTAAGTNVIVSFNTQGGSGGSTFNVDNIYFAYGSGAVVPMTVPSGYLESTGEQVSRTTYADLFAITSTNFGTGNGTTTFNLPQDWPFRLQPTIIKT